MWDVIEQHCAAAPKWLNELAAEFQAAETSLQHSVQQALQRMVVDACEIAHLDEGRLQRLVEEEALALNVLILQNRYVATSRGLTSIRKQLQCCRQPVHHYMSSSLPCAAHAMTNA